MGTIPPSVDACVILGLVAHAAKSTSVMRSTVVLMAHVLQERVLVLLGTTGLLVIVTMLQTGDVTRTLSLQFLHKASTMHVVARMEGRV